MNWLINNWWLILAAAAIVAFIVVWIIRFFRQPTANQVANLKEWLKFAVAEAEKELGSGTGQLKLRQVYDWAIIKFPWVALIVSFENFSVWVNEALDWLDDQLRENEKIEGFVEGIKT